MQKLKIDLLNSPWIKIILKLLEAHYSGILPSQYSILGCFFKARFILLDKLFFLELNFLLSFCIHHYHNNIIFRSIKARIDFLRLLFFAVNIFFDIIQQRHFRKFTFKINNFYIGKIKFRRNQKKETKKTRDQDEVFEKGGHDVDLGAWSSSMSSKKKEEYESESRMAIEKSNIKIKQSQNKISSSVLAKFRSNLHNI